MIDWILIAKWIRELSIGTFVSGLLLLIYIVIHKFMPDIAYHDFLIMLTLISWWSYIVSKIYIKDVNH